MHTRIKYIAILGPSIACFLFSSGLNATNASAYTASITTNDSIELDITPNGNGTSIHSESINVTSDCRAGYNLTIATPEGSNLYKYENNTQSSSTASFTAVDGTSALNSDNNTNKWGYTLTSDPNSNTVFSPLSATASVLKTPSQTASPSSDIDDTFNINYGAKVDNTVEAGTYQMANNGAIVYYLTMDTTCTQYTVSFNPNGGTGTVKNQGIEPGESTKLTSADSLTAPQGASYIDADNDTINGQADKVWVFWGWNTQIDGSGDWYKDREEVEDLASIGSTFTLYAQWKQATLADMVAGTPVATEKVIDHNLMQDISPEACYNSTAYVANTSSPAHTPYDASTNPNGYHTITLLDYRGKVTTGENPESPESYTVSKLPDNLCWMTKDLNLGRESGGENNDGTVTLTPDDTDITTNFTLPASPTPYATGYAGYNAPQILINHTVTSYTISNISYSPIIGHYSWAAATATNISISTSGEVTTSICPKNWDLPSRIQLYNLRSVGSITNAAIAHAAPYNFVYGGYRNAANGYYNQTSYGYYWTSSNSSSNYGYWNYVYSSGIYNSSTSSGYKYYGAKVRCIVPQGKVNISYDGNNNNGGSTASQTNIDIATAKTASNGYTKDDYWFSGWNTEPDGSGISIGVGESISSLAPKPGGVITLYAQWLPQYTITYVNNCQTYVGANNSCTQTVSDGTSEQRINLDANGDGSDTLAAYDNWNLTGWKIKGWSTVTDNSSNTNIEYPVSSSYTVDGQGIGAGITLYAHWMPSYSIQYDGNGADNPNGMGILDTNTGEKSVKQINIIEGDPVTLLASNFKRAGYGFIGWSTDNSAWNHFTDNDNSNDPVIYGPMETITAPSRPISGNITLYAVWVPAKTISGTPVYLQDFSTSDCGSLSKVDFNSATGEITAYKNTIIALTDKRDNQVYAIAKLADGNCWLVENLRLDSAGTLGNNINDSSVTNQSLSQGYGGATGIYGHFVGLANPEIVFHDITTPNSIYKSSTSSPVDTYDPINNILEDIGTSNYPSERFPRYSNANTNDLVDSTVYTQDYSDINNVVYSGTYDNTFSRGHYYTWSAAMANTSYFNNNSSAEAAGTSICPAGWYLPSTSYGVGEYSDFSRSYGGTGNAEGNETGSTMSKRFRSFPNNFIYSGSAIHSTYGTVSDRDSLGEYWSRSNHNLFAIAPTYVSMSNIAHPGFYGINVRCIMNPSTVEIALDSNDGTGAVSRIYGTPGDTINLPQRSKADYKHTGWNTLANGSGTNYTTSYTIPLDSTGTTLYIQWAPLYSIQYDGNGASNSNGMGTTDTNGIKSVKQINIAEGDSVTLLASNFKRAGYGFVGWSTDNDAWAHFTDNDNTNDPIIYGPNETISAPAAPGNGTSINTMYAVWAPAEKDGNNNPVYLQDFDIKDCDSLTSASFDSTTGKITTGSIMALTDKRDNQVYAIAKLADGVCWMMENLRLDNQYTMGQNQNDNTVSNRLLAQGYDGGGSSTLYGSFIGLANSETSNFSNSTTSNSVYKSSASTPVDIYDPLNNVLQDIGTNNSPGYRFPRYNNTNTYSLVDSPTYTQNYADTSNPSDSGTNYRTSSNIYSYGNYYNWSAARASASDLTENYSTNPIRGDTSICPTGWRLPSSSITGDGFRALSQYYGGTGSNQSSSSGAPEMSNRLRSFPNNYLYSGYRTGSSMSNRGTTGYYWSESPSGSTYAYDFSLSSSSFSPYTTNYKYLGYSIRCVVDNVFYTIQYDGNGASNSNGMGTINAKGKKSVKQNGIVEGIRITSLASNFMRAGYGFVGWSTDDNAWAHFTDNDNTNDPIIYGPNEDILVDTNIINYSNNKDIITLYAVWAPAEKDGDNNPVYLQEWDDPNDATDGCAALTKVSFDDTIINEKGKIVVNKNSVIALTDKRDNEVYTIARLADGNCWMIENLRLNSPGTLGNNTNDSNVTNESLSQGYGGITGTYGNFVGLADSESSNFSNMNVSNSVYRSSSNPPVDTYDPLNNTLEDIGTTNSPNYRLPRYNNSNTYNLADSAIYSQRYNNVGAFTDNGTDYRASLNIYSYGNYYNWPVAMANTSHYNDSASSEAAGTSICPNGWHLPSSNGANKEFGTLSQSYGGDGNSQGNDNDGNKISNRFRSFPNNFILSGYFSGHSVFNRGGIGYYQSKSTPGSNSVYELYFSINQIDPSYRNSIYKYYGYSVRCLTNP